MSEFDKWMAEQVEWVCRYYRSSDDPGCAALFKLNIELILKQARDKGRLAVLTEQRDALKE